MEAKKSVTVMTRVQIALAVIAVVGLCWIGFKAFEYNQAQQVYQDIEAEYGTSSGLKACPVDLAKLQKEYPETVGWLKMDDLDISYPVMQAKDNDTYLHVDPHGDYSIDGSIFLDYRSNPNMTDLNAIVYGHNMIDGSMFGNLPKYTDEEFYKKGKGTFTYYTVDAAYQYKIFAVSVVDPQDDIYQMGFKDPKVFDGFVKELAEKSMYDTGVAASGANQVMTLSTCSDSDRLVVSAIRVQ